MGYDYRKPENRARAASLLRQLKDQLIDVSGVRVDTFSNVFASAEAYWQLSKAAGVHVYREGDGWHADLEFKGLPKGVPTVVGTPAPVPTRAEAMESVVGMMSICAQRDLVPSPDPQTSLRWFRLDRQEIPVDPNLLAEYVDRVAAFGIEQVDIIAELVLCRRDIAGRGPVTPENWAAATFETRLNACKVCCMAMALGVWQDTCDPSIEGALDMYPGVPAMH